MDTEKSTTTNFISKFSTSVCQTLFQNGFHFNILLFAFKLAPLASFKAIKILLNFELGNKVRQDNLNTSKRILKWWPFWKKVYESRNCSGQQCRGRVGAVPGNQTRLLLFHFIND